MATKITTSTHISMIYKSRVVLLEQLQTQKYKTSEYTGFSVNDINTMKTNNQLDMILSKEKEGDTDGKETKIYVKYYLNKSLRPSNLQEMIDDLFTVEGVLTKTDTLFIIIKGEVVNDTLMDSLKHIWESEGIFIIIQPLNCLQFNVLTHRYVPEHIPLSELEKIELKSKLNIMNDTDFPELPRFDPVAKAIGIRPGQVCKIMRPSKTAIASPYYRICV